MNKELELLQALESQRVENCKSLEVLRRGGAAVEHLIYQLENFGRDVRARISLLPKAESKKK